MKYIFILLLGFLFVGSTTVSLAADGSTTEKSQIVEDVGLVSTLDAEIDFYIISKIAKENLLLIATPNESLFICKRQDPAINKNTYIKDLKTHNYKEPAIWQRHRGKRYIS